MHPFLGVSLNEIAVDAHFEERRAISMAIFALEKHEMGQLFDALLHKGIHTYKRNIQKQAYRHVLKKRKRSKRHAKAQFLWCVKKQILQQMA